MSLKDTLKAILGRGGYLAATVDDSQKAEDATISRDLEDARKADPNLEKAIKEVLG